MTTSTAFETFLTHLDEYIADTGHANVPASHIAADGYRLGGQVGKARTLHADVKPDQVTALEHRPGWAWDGNDAKLRTFLNHLDEYIAEFGHANVPTAHIASDGYRLGSQVSNTRGRRHMLRADRAAELETRHGWTWNTVELRFDMFLEHLDQYVTEHGNACVPTAHRSADGYRLGIHVSKLRARRNTLTADRSAELEKRAGWKWAARQLRAGE